MRVTFDLVEEAAYHLDSLYRQLESKGHKEGLVSVLIHEGGRFNSQTRLWCRKAVPLRPPAGGDLLTVTFYDAYGRATIQRLYNANELGYANGSELGRAVMRWVEANNAFYPAERRLLN